MTSVPPAADKSQPPPEILTEQMSRLDGCPECVVNTEAPFDVEARTNGFEASYRCADCGHRWSTSWMED